MCSDNDIAHVRATLHRLILDELQLEPDDLPLDRPFYEVANSSLTLVETFRKVGDTFGVRPSLRQVFDRYHTVEGLAGYLVELMNARPAAQPEQSIALGEGYARLPLTEAQQQLLFLAELRDEAATAWNETIAVRLTGDVDEEALAAAFQSLVDRHEALRARLAKGGEALVVARSATATLQRHDLAGADDPRAALAALLAAETETPFSLEQSLFRGQLVTLDGLAVLVLSGHGLVVDRPALHALLSELSAHYDRHRVGAAIPAGREGGLAEAQQDRSRPVDRDFWRARFADRIPELDLPRDRARPEVKTYAGARIVMPLEGVGGGESFAELAALFALLVSRWSATEDVVVGTFASDWLAKTDSCANRTNPLPLRLRVDEELSFSAWVEHVRGAILDAVDHAAWPFAALVRDLDPPRDQSRSPMFTVAIDREIWPAESGGLEHQPLTTPSRRARYDLHLRVVEGRGLSQLQCDFSTDLWTAERIRGWLEVLRAAWQRVRSEPQIGLSAIAALSDSERDELLSAQRGPTRPPSEANLLTAICARAAATPSATAVIAGDERWSYAELSQRAAWVAEALRARGVSPGDRVGISLPRGASLIQAVLGVLEIGAAFVPIDPDYPAERTAFIVDDAGLAALISDDAVTSESVVTLNIDPAGVHDTPLRGDVAADAVAYMIYTSGSTGRPKGVAVAHRSAVNLVAWGLETFSQAELAGMLFSTSLSFDVAVFELFTALASGGTLVVADNALALASSPHADAVTLVSTVPSVMRELLRLGALPPSVTTVVLAGEALPRDLVADVFAAGAKRVLNAYGPTEATVYATVAELSPTEEDAPTIGRPLPNVASYVLDSHLRPVPRGAVGELCLGGAGVALGYHRRDELNRAAFVADPFAEGGRLYRTGDLVRLRADGELDFLGRRDQQVKLHGFRIELDEIATALRADSSIHDAVVVVRDDGQGDQLVAYLVGDDIEPARLREAVGARLPRYMVPAAFVALPAIPKLPNGKLDRAALPAPSAARDERAALGYQPPRMGMEQVLADIWMDLLALDRVGRDDDFFELGGDSLKLGPMMIEVERRVGVRLTLAELFAASRLDALAAHLEHLRQHQADEHRVRRHLPRTGDDVDARFALLSRDATLDPKLQVTASAAQPAKLREVLITGVTGFVGAHTFADLLQQTDSLFTCPVRASDAEAGMDRIVASLKKYDLWRDEYRPRITAVVADLASERLGLSEATFRRIAAEADAIIHMAAQVNFIYPYEALKRVNVDGVRQMLALAFAERPTPFHYVSTAAIWPMGRHRRFLETDSIEQGIRLNLGYDESKWVAEKLVFEARRRGLPASIYRPGEVSGHSENGRIVLDHFMFAIMKGSLQLGGAPRVLAKVDMAPVNYVAGAIANMVQRPELLGSTFHLNNPFPGSPEELYAVLREYGYHFDILPMEEWLDFVLTTPDLRDNALFPYTAVLGEFVAENLEFPLYDTTEAQKALAGTGIQCPAVDVDLVRTYIEWFLSVGFLPRPEQCRRR